MSTSEKFCLKWNDFQKNMSSFFQDIREDFCDVTLTGEGNQKILAHKVILAASSNFFKEILKENPHPHPLLYMKGIKGAHLTSLVDFMYHGEVNIYQEDLNNFLLVADELQLKGLQANKHSDVNIYQVADANYLETSTLEKRQETENRVEMTGAEFDNNGAMVELSLITTTNAELDEQIRYMMNNSEGQWSCNLCGKADKNKANIVNHIERKHIQGVSHQCNHCGKGFRSRQYLSQHFSKTHKIQE